MGQVEIIEMLKKSKKPLTEREIRKKLGNSSSVYNTLKKLRERKEIKYVLKIDERNHTKHHYYI